MSNDNGDIYKILLEIKEQNGRHEEKLDTIAELVKTHDEKISKHDDFIATVKTKVAVYSSVFGSIVAIFGFLMTKIDHIISFFKHN